MLGTFIASLNSAFDVRILLVGHIADLGPSAWTDGQLGAAYKVGDTANVARAVTECHPPCGTVPISRSFGLERP